MGVVLATPLLGLIGFVGVVQAPPLLGLVGLMGAVLAPPLLGLVGLMGVVLAPPLLGLIGFMGVVLAPPLLGLIGFMGVVLAPPLLGLIGFMGLVLAPVLPVMALVLALVLPVMRLIGPMISMAALLLHHIFPRPYRGNPTFDDIEARRQVEQAGQAAREAQELAQRIQWQADQDREQACARQGEANQAAARAAEETARMRARMEEAAEAVKCAEELAEKAFKAAEDEAAGLVQEETEKAIKAKEEAEMRLKEGIQPVVIPSPEEVAAAKRRIQYKDDCFHFAVAGISGSGKSSLVNAFRGLRGKDAGAAAVGVTETTLQMARYPDANPDSPFVWYDIPGAGTLQCRDWQYFNDQGLYVFDCIVILFDNRFTMTDIAILVNARRFNIPTYIVRSKADLHILNTMMEMGSNSEGDEADVGRRNKDKLYRAARKQFIEETRKIVRANLEGANLPHQRVYIVSNTALLNIVRNKTPKKAIDEVDLLNDLVHQVYSRRASR